MVKRIALLPIAVLLLTFLCVGGKQVTNQSAPIESKETTGSIATQNLGMSEIDLSKFKDVAFYQIKEINNQYVLAGINSSLEKDTLVVVYLENGEVKSYDELSSNEYTPITVVGIKEEDEVPVIYCSGYRNEDFKNVIIYFKGKEIRTIELDKDFFVVKDLDDDIIPIVPSPEMGYCNVNTQKCVLIKFGNYSIGDGIVKEKNGNYYFFVSANDENTKYYFGFAKDKEKEGVICRHEEGGIIYNIYLQNAFIGDGKAIVVFNDPWIMTTTFALFDINNRKFEKVIEVGNIFLSDIQFINDDDGYVIAGVHDEKGYVVKFDKSLNIKWAREISFGTIGMQLMFEAKKEGDYYKIIGLYYDYSDNYKLYFLTIGKDGSYNSGRVSNIDLSYVEVDANNFKCEPVSITYQ